MDMLGDEPVLDLSDESWRIYSKHESFSPHYVGKGAVVKNSTLTEGCEIYGEVVNSVLGANVKIMRGALVRDSVIFDNVTIGENAKVNYSIIDSNVSIGSGAAIGAQRDTARGVAVIGGGVTIANGTIVNDGDIISSSSEVNN